MTRYQEAISDPEILAMRDDLALIDVRVAELLERVNSGESGARSKRLTDIWRTVEAARTRQDTAALAAALTEVGTIICDGGSDAAAWTDIVGLIEQRRKLSDSEHKRLVAMQQMVTAEDAMAFVAALQASVQRHVRDPVALRAIAQDMQDLANRKRAYAA